MQRGVYQAELWIEISFESKGRDNKEGRVQMLLKITLKLKYYVNIKAGLLLLKSNYVVCFNVA